MVGGASPLSNRVDIDRLVKANIQGLSSKAAGPLKDEAAIRLDKGELPYPPSSKVLDAIAAAATSINRYPDVLGGALRLVLAAYTGAAENQIIVTNGSDDLIELVLKTCLQPGDEVLLPIPTFFVYGHLTQVIGGTPVCVQRTKEFGVDLDDLLQAVTPQTKVIFLANPNNPTANSIEREVILDLLNRVECLVVVDECYYELCQLTVADLIDDYPHLIVLRSLSKSFGLAGLRVGYGIANERLIDYLYRAAQLFPVNKLAIAAAVAALADIDTVRSNLQAILQHKTGLERGLQQLGFQVYPSATNFLLVNTEPLGIPSAAIVQFLRERNIFVADFGLKPGLSAYCFRTAVGLPRENQVLLDTLAQAISSLS